MSYHGDIRLGDTIDIKFSSRSFSTGAPTTLAGTPAVAAYVGNSTTEITAGITLTVDFDSRTGLHNVRVVASAGNGYATASNYQLVLTAGTVGGVSVVGEVIGTFSIEARSALMPATAGRTAVVDAAGLVDANVVKVGPTGSGTAQTARDIGASVLVGDKTGFSLSSAGVQAMWDALTSALTTVGSIGKKLVDSVTQTGDSYARIGAAGAGLTALGDARVANLDATVSSRLAAAGYTAPDNTSITAIKAKTDNLPAAPAAVGDIPTAVQIAAQVLTVALTESYRANGAAPTLAQAMCEVLAHLGETSIAGTTKTIKKIDHSTTAATFTLNDATTPTSITRAS